MSTSRALFVEFLECLCNIETSVDRCVDLFAEDGTFEFPYFTSLGMPWRFSGKAEIRQVLQLMVSHFSTFDVSNVEVHELKDVDGLFVRYHSDAIHKGTNRPYAQDYVSQVLAANGRIKLLREYLNVISTARILLPNGLADLPAPLSS